MSNFANVLKTEITRIARKEIKAETEGLRKAASDYRRDIAALKRQVATLERALGKVAKTTAKPVAADADDAPAKALRFSASRLAAQRQRLGLSAESFGKLLGVSGQSIYKWESGKVRPRANQLEAIAAARKLGKAEAKHKIKAL